MRNIFILILFWSVLSEAQVSTPEVPPDNFCETGKGLDEILALTICREDLNLLSCGALQAQMAGLQLTEQQKLAADKMKSEFGSGSGALKIYGQTFWETYKSTMRIKKEDYLRSINSRPKLMNSEADAQADEMGKALAQYVQKMKPGPDGLITPPLAYLTQNSSREAIISPYRRRNSEKYIIIDPNQSWSALSRGSQAIVTQVSFLAAARQIQFASAQKKAVIDSVQSITEPFTENIEDRFLKRFGEALEKVAQKNPGLKAFIEKSLSQVPTVAISNLSTFLGSRAMRLGSGGLVTLLADSTPIGCDFADYTNATPENKCQGDPTTLGIKSLAFLNLSEPGRTAMLRPGPVCRFYKEVYRHLATRPQFKGLVCHWNDRNQLTALDLTYSSADTNSPRDQHLRVNMKGEKVASAESWWLDEKKAGETAPGGGKIVGQYSQFLLNEKGELSQVHSANQRNYNKAFNKEIKNTEEQTVDLTKPHITYDYSYKERLQTFSQIKTFASEAVDCCQNPDERFRQTCMAQFHSGKIEPEPSTPRVTPATK